MVGTLSAQARSFGQGLLVAVGCGVAIGVAVVLFLYADVGQAVAVCFFVPLAVLALVAVDRLRSHRPYALGMLCGTVACVPVIGLMVAVFASVRALTW